LREGTTTSGWNLDKVVGPDPHQCWFN
jgi:hypothetical protein